MWLRGRRRGFKVRKKKVRVGGNIGDLKIGLMFLLVWVYRRIGANGIP
jgi:hypothetical protein